MIIMNLKIKLDVNVIEFSRNNLFPNLKTMKILRILETLIRSILIYLKMNIMRKNTKLDFLRKLLCDSSTVETVANKNIFNILLEYILTLFVLI